MIKRNNKKYRITTLILCTLMLAEPVCLSVNAQPVESTQQETVPQEVTQEIADETAPPQPQQEEERVQVTNSEVYVLADGVTYTKNYLQDLKYGPVRTYTIEYTPGLSSGIVFAMGEKLYRAKSLQTLAESVKNEQMIPVGAINADFFNMSTGVPVSAFIKDGVLLTTDLGNNCFAIDSDGTAFFEKPEIQINMRYKGADNQVIVMNKEFLNYSMCLYTDAYSDTTKIKSASTEVVLTPYSRKASFEEMYMLTFKNMELPNDFYIVEQSQTSDMQISQHQEAQNIVAENDATDTLGQLPSDGASIDNTIEVGEVVTVNPTYRQKIDEYAQINGYERKGNAYYVFESAAPKIGKSQKALVTQVRINQENGGVHDIPQGSYVLASDNKAFGHMLAKYSVNEEVVFTFSGNEKFYNVEQAIGAGCMIVEDGSYVENTDVSHYNTLQPRSAVGVTQEGKIVLMAVDGRQSGVSVGMKLEDLAQEMLKAGCVNAANLDGGGSTAIKAYLAFDNSFSTVNKPSDLSERRVANAIVVTNNKKPTGIAYYSYLKDNGIYVLPKGSVSIGNPYYTDENHYAVPSESVIEEFEYNSGENGYVAEGTYYPDGFVGKAQINSVNNKGITNVAANIISTDSVDEVTVTSDVSEIYVGQAVDFSASSTKYGYEVHGDDNAYTWSVNSDYGNIMENGLFFSQNTFGDVEISASVGNTAGLFNLKVKELPFKDITGHWGVWNICELYDDGVVVGENTPDGAMFFPDRTYSRNEFCVMLSRIMGLTGVPSEIPNDEDSDIQAATQELSTESAFEVNETPVDEQNETSEEVEDIKVDNIDNVPVEEVEAAVNEQPPMEFADYEDIPHWAYDSVLALYELGVLSNFAHSGMMFDGQMPVTRREVISVIGEICQAAPEDFEISFGDVFETEADYDYIKNAIYAGIFEGYEDGTLRVERNLTRAEGAAVFVRLAEYFEGLKI